MFSIQISRLLFLLLAPSLCESPALPDPFTLPVLEARWQEASSRLRSQWQNPSDVLTVLLIIGGDVVQKALAQLSGGYFVPVAFSFGWVSYSISALLVVYSEGTLMPSTLYPSVLINTQSGYARLNYSWILNRLLRGIESSREPLDAALCVSVYRCKPNGRRNAHDLLWWSGIFTIGLQLGISSIPIFIERDWTTLLVTGTGTLLALVGGSLPQWRNEKWGGGYDEKGSTFCLTRGNGFQHVVVIQNEAKGCLNLEHLAPPRRTGCSRGCKIVVMICAFLWILFLINVCGIRQNTWYLLGVGFMGMIQNIFVAATPRQPSAMGLPLEFVDRIDGKKVMGVLMETETRFPSVGAALVQTFFPGKLRDHEQSFWSARKESAMKLTKTPTANVQQSITPSLSLAKSSTISSQPPHASRTIQSTCQLTNNPVIGKRRASV